MFSDLTKTCFPWISGKIKIKPKIPPFFFFYPPPIPGPFRPREAEGGGEGRGGEGHFNYKMTTPPSLPPTVPPILFNFHYIISLYNESKFSTAPEGGGGSGH
nr:hypothetical protein [Morchella crassipes]